MPFVIPAIIAAGIQVAAGVAIETVLANAAIGLVLGGLAQALVKKPSQGGASSAFDAQNRSLTVQQPISPWQVVFGEVRVGGTVTFAYRRSDGAALHLVITLACHPCAAIEEIILNGDVITPDMLDATGRVIAGNWAPPAADAHTESFDIGGGLTATVAQAVASVESVAIGVLTVDGDRGFLANRLTSIPLTDVSPSAPASGQYKRVGQVFTFASDVIGQNVVINYSAVGDGIKVGIQMSLGTEAGQPFPNLIVASEGRWTDAHRQTGHTKIWVRLPADVVYSGGIPQISAVLRGVMPVDPRTGVAGWTPNPAILAGWYLAQQEFGFGGDLNTDVDAATQQAAANICEERVAVDATALGGGATFTATTALGRLTLVAPVSGEVVNLNGTSTVPVRTPRTGDGVRLSSSGALPSPLAAGTTYYVIRNAAGLVQLASSFANACAGTALTLTNVGSGTHTLTPYDEPRYTANGSFLTSSPRGDFLDGMRGAMAGRLVQIADKWQIFAGAYEAPTVTLDESEMAGAIHIDPVPATADAANTITGVFVDTANDYQPTDFPAVSDDTYIEQDGGEAITATLDLTGFVTSSAQAQRLAKIELRRRRFALSWNATFMLSAYRAMTARTIAMNFAKYGWVNGNQEFEITAMGFGLVQSAAAAGSAAGGGAGGAASAPALGITLSGRQTAPEIWDWDVSEQQLQSIVRATALPTAFDVAAPGVPGVAEQLYATTGSAGVKSRATVTWQPGDGTPVDHYDFRWKAVGDAGYTYPPPIFPAIGAAAAGDSASFVLDDRPAGLYLFGVRAVNARGYTSAWVTVQKELLGLTAPPDNITGFAVQGYAGQAKFVWDKPDPATNLDVLIGGRVFVRFSPKTSGAAWENGTLVDPAGYAGDASNARGPLQTGTYLAKAQDSTGNWSVNAASFVVTEAQLIQALSAFVTITESPAFAGAKTNVAAVDGGLQLNSTTLIDGMLSNVDTWDQIDSLGGLQASGSYAFSQKLDAGSVQNLRLYATIDSLAFDTGDLWDSRSGLVDDWNSIDGDAVEDVDVELYVRVTNDDPAGSPSWGPWHAQGLVADYVARGFDFRLDFATGNVTHNRKVTALSVAAKQ